MYHIAILKKSLRLLPKIVNGEKTIESRWYKTRRAPWNQVKKGEVVYFKNSGEPVTVKAIVEDVKQFELTRNKIEQILQTYGSRIGVDSTFVEDVKDKKYCILIFLHNAQEVEPFDVDKTGYGNMAAWMSAQDK